MKKFKYFISLILLSVLFLSGCQAGLDNKQSTPTNLNPEKDPIVYINSIHNFKLTFPATWEGRYDVRETQGEASFLYKSKTGSTYSFLTILIEPEKEWKEFSEPLGGVGPFQEIATKDGLVYIHVFPQENPYDGTEELKEYDALLEESWSVVGSLSF